MTLEDFEEAISRMNDGTMAKKVALMYYKATGPIGDKYIADTLGIRIRQVSETRTGLYKSYDIEFERTGTLNHYQRTVKLDGVKKKRTIKDKVDYSGLATGHRKPPLCWFFGLAKPPQPV